MTFSSVLFNFPSLLLLLLLSLHSCLTLCSPIEGSPPGSPVPGIHQARTLEWIAISFPNGWKWKGKVKLLSCVRLLATPWTAAHQAPPSMGFSRQEYWSGAAIAFSVKRAQSLVNNKHKIHVVSPLFPSLFLSLSMYWVRVRGKEKISKNENEMTNYYEKICQYIRESLFHVVNPRGT